MAGPTFAEQGAGAQLPPRVSDSIGFGSFMVLSAGHGRRRSAVAQLGRYAALSVCERIGGVFEALRDFHG